MGEMHLRNILKNRWLGLCLGMWMQACGGISYVFSLYSADLKHCLGYNQEMIDGLGTSKDIGGNVGIVSGLLIDTTSAWFVLLVGGLMHFVFYTMVHCPSLVLISVLWSLESILLSHLLKLRTPPSSGGTVQICLSLTIYYDTLMYALRSLERRLLMGIWKWQAPLRFRVWSLFLGTMISVASSCLVAKLRVTVVSNPSTETPACTVWLKLLLMALANLHSVVSGSWSVWETEPLKTIPGSQIIRWERISGCPDRPAASAKTLYLAASGQISPSYWQMCLIIMLGTNGATWFNTAVLVTWYLLLPLMAFFCLQGSGHGMPPSQVISVVWSIVRRLKCVPGMRNFPSDRGVVVGLLKGFIGLSGAIFTQVYTAVYAPSTGPFLLFCACVPPMVALVSMLVIQPIDAPKHKDETDKLKFSILYVVGLGLAFYLMVVILIQDFFGISKSASRFFMAVMVIILLLPGIIPWRWGAGQHQSGYTKLSTDGQMTQSPAAMHTPTKRIMEPLLMSKLSTAIDVTPRSHEAQNGALDTSSKQRIKLGQDHTLWQAWSTHDYWLLFFAMGCGTGSGLTAINNLAQMAESLGSRSIGAFVALVSVWNFLGRMASGYLSEYYMKKHATPRPLFLLLVQLVMACGHLLFASSVPTMLYIASILVGLAHGAHWTLMVATSSELFGLQNFGALYNTLSISSTLGSYILSVKLAGYLYDRQVAAAQALAMKTGQEVSLSHKCAGPDCFRSTFLVMACVCGLGCVALIRLTARTRKVYHNMYKLQQGKDAPGDNPESLDSLPLLSKDSSSEEGVLSDNTAYTAHTVSDAHHRHGTPNRA